MSVRPISLAQNGDAPAFLAEDGADAAKWCAWKEMTHFGECDPAIFGLEGRCSDGCERDVASSDRAEPALLI